MFAAAIITFREFLEAFILIGIFIGIDRKFQLGKRKEILLAALLGIIFSLLLPILVFFFSADIQHIVTEKNADIVEGYFLTFSGFFLAYVVFSMHTVMKHGKNATLAKAREKMKQEIFDISLFLTIVFFIAREGFEVTLLIATTSFFSSMWAKSGGLFIGFLAASFIGLVMCFTYIKLPMKKLFLYTEYFIILIGAAMVKNGISLLITNYLHIHVEKFLSLPLQFLPGSTTILGHTLNNLFGLQQETSILQLGMMGLYVALVLAV